MVAMDWPEVENEFPMVLGSNLAELGGRKSSVDRDATIRAYAQAERGGADRCTCNGCRNFRLARMRVFPPEFLELLDRLGIDPRKDGEVYRNARLAPGRHNYGGWFHFIGTLDAPDSDSGLVKFGDDFSAYICRATAPRLPSLNQHPVVQLEFNADAVPWLLDEPEAD